MAHDFRSEPRANVQANLLNDYLLPHEKGEKKRVPKRKGKPVQSTGGDPQVGCNTCGFPLAPREAASSHAGLLPGICKIHVIEKRLSDWTAHCPLCLFPYDLGPRQA